MTFFDIPLGLLIKITTFAPLILEGKRIINPIHIKTCTQLLR